MSTAVHSQPARNKTTRPTRYHPYTTSLDVTDAENVRWTQTRFATIDGGPMQIDMHSHVLALAQDPEFNTVYGREGLLCIYRSRGLVPSHRMPTEEEGVNEWAERIGVDPIPDEKLTGIMGDNAARVLGL